MKALGWEPMYFVCSDEDMDVRSMCLAHFRPYKMSSGLVTCSGGPTGDAGVWGKGLKDKVRISAGVKRLYFRLRCDRDDLGNYGRLLRERDWTVPSSAKTSGLTMELDIDRSEKELYTGLSKNWKKNLKSARNKQLSVRVDTNPNAAEIHHLFAGLESRKNLPELFSEKKFEALFDRLGSGLLVLRCEDKRGKLVAVRVTAIQSGYAVDYLAASNELGRKLKASYYLLWEMFMRCRAAGVKIYDLGGVDPENNHGVYYFKRGTGASLVRQVGELDWATGKYIRTLVNAAIGFQETWKTSRIRNAFVSIRGRSWAPGQHGGTSLKKSRVN